MDALAGLLDGPRAQGAFLLRCVMDPPWAIRVQDEAPLCLVAIVRGHTWLAMDGGDAVRLGAGDIAIIRGPDPYTMGDEPDTPIQAVIHPGERCMSMDGVELAQQMDLGVRTWGNDLDGGMVMLVGTYLLDGEVSQRLLRALPTLLVLPASAWDSQALVGLLSAEIVKEHPGQEAVLDRLLDLILIAALRTWFSRPGISAPAWYRAYDDPIVGRALRMLHHNPGHQWTVAGLASAAGVSRAALARRFTELVGEPPMAFLTGWRLALAADLLREPDATLEAVARKVGYSSAFALSTAFKRVRGISPRDYRARAAVEPALTS